jgi:hypothetical protein
MSQFVYSVDDYQTFVVEIGYLQALIYIDVAQPSGLLRIAPRNASALV